MQGFTKTVADFGLLNLGFIREKFTWEKSRGKYKWIQKRLDRGLTNNEWCQLFSSTGVQVLEVPTSDHLPLFLHINKKVYQEKER